MAGYRGLYGMIGVDMAGIMWQDCPPIITCLPIWQYSPVHSDVQLHIPGAVHSPPFSQSGLHTAV